MNIDTRLAANLEKLFSVEPSLAQQLQEEAGDLDRSIRLTVEAARRHDIALSADELDAFLRSASAEATLGELTDEQLEGVNGAGPARDIATFIIRQVLPIFGINAGNSLRDR